MKKAKKGTKRVAKTAQTQKRVERKFWPYGIAIFAVLLALDQWTKNTIVSGFALGESRQALPWLSFTYVRNTGTLWGMLNGADLNWAFIYLSVIAFGLLLFFFDHFETVVEKIAYTFIMVGLWGNLLDRGLHGAVIDFIDLGWWPIFNIADACISVAIVLLLLEQFRRPAES